MESEPVIVVDQENCFNEEDEDIDDVAGNGQGCPDTPPQDPFFLSPFRDMRKRSLPTPQCTSGITASQVIFKKVDIIRFFFHNRQNLSKSNHTKLN